MNWVRVKRDMLCPLCGKPDWCCVSGDGTVAYCMRVESPKPCRAGGWFHKLDEPLKYKSASRKTKPVPVRNFASLASRYVEDLTDIDGLAKELGVSVRSLERLQVGWNGQGYTFPMRDGREEIIGIQVRGRKGKWAVSGSRNGLFWPEGVYSGSDWPLVICEGPTDCAALLDMEFDAIGRPSCSGGVGYIVEFLQGRRRDVVIMADNDEPKEGPDGCTWRPGQDGAARLAQTIAPWVRTVRIVKPPFHKDVREWFKAGATRDAVRAVIQNTRYVP